LEGADRTATADAVMEAGPSTVRPDVTVDDLRARLDEGGLKTAIVTTPEGKLVGVAHRRQME
jgi:CBS domain-containing protein